jgi:hypothetical protein
MLGQRTFGAKSDTRFHRMAWSRVAALPCWFFHVWPEAGVQEPPVRERKLANIVSARWIVEWRGRLYPERRAPSWPSGTKMWPAARRKHLLGGGAWAIGRRKRFSGQR